MQCQSAIFHQWNPEILPGSHKQEEVIWGKKAICVLPELLLIAAIAMKLSTASGTMVYRAAEVLVVLHGMAALTTFSFVLFPPPNGVSVLLTSGVIWATRTWG
ncbi:hypothetical protein B5X24_HaOG213148 [Helicoverpa armigera]|nr:hypothetical protein B5X24_HaOG213148 [Helicoverpa armigera]